MREVDGADDNDEGRAEFLVHQSNVPEDVEAALLPPVGRRSSSCSSIGHFRRKAPKYGAVFFGFFLVKEDECFVQSDCGGGDETGLNVVVCFICSILTLSVF